MAGVACYYNYDNYFYGYLSKDDDGREYVLAVSCENRELKESDKVYVDFGGKDFYFKVQVREREAQFYYSLMEKILLRLEICWICIFCLMRGFLEMGLQELW